MSPFDRGVLRVLGNFGTSFLSPLMATSVVLNTEFYDAIIVSLISASIITSLALSREVSLLGREQ